MKNLSHINMKKDKWYFTWIRDVNNWKMRPHMLVQKSCNFDQEDAKWVEGWNGSRNTINHGFSFFLIGAPFVGVWNPPYLPLFIFFMS